MGKRKIPEVLSREEQKKLLNVFNTRYLSPHRNKTMISLMLNTGLRLSEIINLKWKHLDLQTGKLKVVEGKGSKDRILWINNETLEKLRNWRERQVREVGNMDHVFTTRTGNKLDPSDVRSMIYTYSKKAGIQEEVEKHYTDEKGNELFDTYKEKKIKPHTLRHTFATNLLEKTRNIRIVQKALGHSNLSTTMIYTHIVDDVLEDAMKTFRSKEV